MEFMHNQTTEAARQIMGHASDIHEALALAGRYDLSNQAVKIQKKAACIMRMQQAPGAAMTGYRVDLLNGIGCVAATIEHYQRDWENIDDDGIIAIARSAEVMLERVERYFAKKGMGREEE